jgi:hypothetical protein
MSDALQGDAVLGAAATAGDVLVRNHDLTTDHRLAVRVYGPTGDVQFESGFALAPGAAAARPADLAAGSYTVEVDCDGEDYLVRTHHLDDAEGLLVAAGNGVVDVAARPTR